MRYSRRPGLLLPERPAPRKAGRCELVQHALMMAGGSTGPVNTLDPANRTIVVNETNPLSNGNRTYTRTTTTQASFIVGTKGRTAGLGSFTATATSNGAGGGSPIFVFGFAINGIRPPGLPSTYQFDSNGRGYFIFNGNKSANGSSSAYGASAVLNDVIKCEYDAGSGDIRFYKNGVSQGIAFNVGAGTLLHPQISLYYANASATCDFANW